MKRKLLALVLAALLLLGTAVGCGSRSTPPELYEIYDEAVALIEASFAVNDALFGYGAPVIEIGSDYAEQLSVYSGSDFANYELMRDEAPYRSIDELKAAMSAVYSEDYANSLYSTLFDGFVAGSTLLQAQYREDAKGFYLRTDYEPLLGGQRIYDYATMRIVEPSSADYVNIEIDTHLEHDDTVLTVALSLVLEGGEWRLDTPTY